MKPEELEHYLNKDTPATVYILTGTERLLMDECTRAIRAHFESDAGSQYEPQSFHPQKSKNDAEKIEPAAILDTLRSASLFGGRPFVVVHGGGFLFSEYKDVFRRYFVAPSKRNVLVMEIEKYRTTKAVTEAGTTAVIACDAPFDSPPPWRPDAAEYDTPLAAWTVARARSAHGKKLTKPAAHALNRMTGRSLERIEGELIKLALYVEERAEIREADIEALSGKDVRGSVFKAAERFFEKDLPGTMEMVRLLFDRGFVDRGGAPVADPIAVCMIAIGTWRSELRKVWRMKQALARRQGKDAIMKQIGLRQDFQYSAAAAKAGKWTDDQLAGLLDALVRLDASLKSTGAPSPAAAFEQFVLARLT